MLRLLSDPSGFFADRFLDTGSGTPTLMPWSGEYGDYREAAGYLVPHHFVGYWHLAIGRVPYVDFRLHTPEYAAVGPFDAPPAEVGGDDFEDNLKNDNLKNGEVKWESPPS